MRKGLLVLIAIVVMGLGVADAQITTSFQIGSENGVKVSDSAEYNNVQTVNGLTTQTQVENQINVTGTIGRLDTSSNSSQGYESQTNIQVSGSISTLQKVGTSNIGTYQNPTDPGILAGFVDHNQSIVPTIYFIDQKTAAGASTRIIGDLSYGSAFSTAEGLYMENKVDFAGQGVWQVGAAQQINAGIMPASGKPEDIINQSIQYYENHVRVVGYNPNGEPIIVSGSYAVDMRPAQ